MTTPTPPAAKAKEPLGARAGRYTRRTWLYTWVTMLVLSLVAIVILIAQNTRSVRVGWILGHSTISLVYLVLVAVVLGWILGIATSVLFRRRTRRL